MYTSEGHIFCHWCPIVCNGGWGGGGGGHLEYKFKFYLARNMYDSHQAITDFTFHLTCIDDTCMWPQPVKTVFSFTPLIFLSLFRA